MGQLKLIRQWFFLNESFSLHGDDDDDDDDANKT